MYAIFNVYSGGVKKGPATKIYTKLKKDVVIETITWLEEPRPNLKLEVWINSNVYFERLGMGYLREMERKYICVFKADGVPKGIKKIVVGFLMLDHLEHGLDWNDPLLVTLLNFN